MIKKIALLILMIIPGFLSCYDDVFDTYDESVVYHLRERGPAGGWIFYINPNYRDDGWRYLEAATEDLVGKCDWGADNQFISSAAGTAIGTGKQDTLGIIAEDAATLNKAADQCVAYNGGGYHDWFMPSINELKELYAVLGSTSADRGTYGFQADVYFSSSELSATDAYGVFFLNGISGNFGKNYSQYVRAIRAF